MFETYNINHITEEVTKHVHEHRAPTDESVKLLKEMEAAAKEKIFSSIRLDANGFSGKLFVEYDILSMMYVFSVLFDLNGIKEKIVKEYPTNMNIEDVFSDLKMAVANKISSAMLNHFIDSANPETIQLIKKMRG